MHEAAIAESLLEQVRSFAPEGSRVATVRIEVGGLEHIEPEVMDVVWRALVLGSPYEGAELAVERVPLRVRCRACGAESQPDDLAILTCGVCDAVRPEVIEGSGILLRSLEVLED